MSKLYKNGRLRLYLNTGTNLEEAVSAKIKVKSPAGVLTEVDAVIQPDMKTIYHYFPSWILDEAGQWLFWSYINFGGGDFNTGEPVIRVIYDEPE